MTTREKKPHSKCLRAPIPNYSGGVPQDVHTLAHSAKNPVERLLAAAFRLTLLRMVVAFLRDERHLQRVARHPNGISGGLQ